MIRAGLGGGYRWSFDDRAGDENERGLVDILALRLKATETNMLPFGPRKLAHCFLADQSQSLSTFGAYLPSPQSLDKQVIIFHLFLGGLGSRQGKYMEITAFSQSI